MDQFRDRRARNKNALVDVEAHAREPGLVNKIRNRHVLANTALDKRVKPFEFIRADRVRVRFGRVIVRQAQVGKYQPRSLVGRIIRAVAITQACVGKSFGSLPDQPLHGHGVFVVSSHWLPRSCIID